MAQPGDRGRRLIVLRHIERERPAVIFARAAIHEACSRFLASLGHRVASAQRASSEKIAKASEDDRETDASHAVSEADWTPLRRESQRHLETVAKDGAKEGLLQVESELASVLDQANEGAVRWAEERAARLIKDISAATEDKVREIISAGLASGDSNDAIARELDESYWFGGDRAETIARTETAFADIQGNLIGWKASGVVAGREWKTSQEDPCENCAALDGEIRPLDEDFEDGDPPLHPRCECVLLPVLSEDQEQE